MTLAQWKNGVRFRPVSDNDGAHSIHAYFNTCPESPDGRFVLFFASTTRDAHTGDVHIRNRANGTETTLARDIRVEDAHRVACQQWVSGGKRVVFHGEQAGQWSVTGVDVESGRVHELAPGRLCGWGAPSTHLVPLYGPHWNPGPHRDLELLNAETGTIETVLTADAVKAAYPEWTAAAFGDHPISIFFPILSPDATRVFFKLATPAGGDARSKQASNRQGLICYSLAERRLLYRSDNWGHPSWHWNSQTILNQGFLQFDSSTGDCRQLPGLPTLYGDHSSASPDGNLIVSDTKMHVFGGKPDDWSVVLATANGSHYCLLKTFDNSQGAESWRRSHPHPVFSPDGRRIYYNVSSGPWTRLEVAELST